VFTKFTCNGEFSGDKNKFWGDNNTSGGGGGVTDFPGDAVTCKINLG